MRKLLFSILAVLVLVGICAKTANTHNVSEIDDFELGSEMLPIKTR